MDNVADVVESLVLCSLLPNVRDYDMTELVRLGLGWLRRSQGLEFGVRPDCCSDFVASDQSFDQNMEADVACKHL